MASIRQEIETLRHTLPEHVRLIAVSKFHTCQEIMQAYEAGQRDFGENKVQELSAKQPKLPKDIRWHMLGHLQRNKVKQVLPLVTLIHSVDSYRLLKEIDKTAEALGLVADCLLEVKVAEEESKYGLLPQNCRAMLAETDALHLPHVRICGLMGMATQTDSPQQITREFDALRALFDELHTTFFAGKPEFKELSMGMSGDYLLAVKAGSTMVRIGTQIFGQRIYPDKGQSAVK